MSPNQEQDLDPFYNLYRDIIAPNRTPPLEAVQPNFESHGSPLHLVLVEASSDSTDAEEPDEAGASRKRRRRKGRTNPTLADGVLIRSLDPNAVELASHSERHPLESASQSEAEEEDSNTGHTRMIVAEAVAQNDTSKASSQSKQIAEAALNAIYEDEEEDDWPMTGSPVPVADERSPRPPPTPAHDAHQRALPPQGQHSLPPKLEASKKKWDTCPPPRHQPLEGLRLKLEPSLEDEDSIIKSPALGRFTITPVDADPNSILPAMQHRSPGQCSPTGSPDQKVTLPSLKTTIGQIHDPSSSRFASVSPILGRPSPGRLSLYTPSPATYQSSHTGMSPPGPPSHMYWRTTRDSNTSTSTEYVSSTPATTSTPASSMIGPSPAASGPSPLPILPEQKQETAQEDVTEDIEPEVKTEPKPPSSDPSSSARSTGGTYKCTSQGCNAAPFQTQYLLNSHMNVHSNTRSHFCPVKGCIRGPGGQGFKRKNEMNR